MKNIKQQLRELILINYVIVKDWKAIDFIRWEDSVKWEKKLTIKELSCAYATHTWIAIFEILEVNKIDNSDFIMKILDWILDEYIIVNKNIW